MTTMTAASRTKKTAPSSHYDRFKLERLGRVLSSEGQDESGGVMNPTAYYDTKGNLVMMYRAVNKEGRSSSLKIATFDSALDKFVRTSVALRPERAYERNGRDGGEGCEDCRVTDEVTDVGRLVGGLVAAYTAYGPMGPRVAGAISKDGHKWERLGLLSFPNHPNLAAMDNKNACVLPQPVISPSGIKSFAIAHRPRIQMPPDGRTDVEALLKLAPDDRPGIWMGYVPFEQVLADPNNLFKIQETMQIFTPDQVPWKTEEQIQIGGGTQFLPLADGNLLTLYHGVWVNLKKGIDPETNRYHLHHWGGLLILDGKRPHRIVARGNGPILFPETEDEIGSGRYTNIAFPTALVVADSRTLRMYYGASDRYICAADLVFDDDISAAS